MKNQNGFQRKRSKTSQLIHWRNTCKKPWSNTFACEGIEFYIQREDGAKTTSIWSAQRNCYNYNDALLKHKSNSSDRDTDFFRYSFWSFAKWYIWSIFVYNLPWLRTSNIHGSNKRKWLYVKNQERQYPWETITYADYTDDLALFANTPAAAESLLQAKSNQQEVLAFTLTQIK